MSSLQDQLLNLGVATKDQAKKANDAKRKKNHANRQKKKTERNKPQKTETQKKIEAEARDKAAKDKALNQEKTQAQEARAREHRIRQMLNSHRMNEADDSKAQEEWNFITTGKVRKVFATAEQKQGLSKGQLGIVWHQSVAHIVPSTVAKKIAEIVPRCVAIAEKDAQAPAEDDPYAEFQVPDDLMW